MWLEAHYLKFYLCFLVDQESNLITISTFGTNLAPHFSTRACSRSMNIIYPNLKQTKDNFKLSVIIHHCTIRFKVPTYGPKHGHPFFLEGNQLHWKKPSDFRLCTTIFVIIENYMDTKINLFNFPTYYSIIL